MLPSAVSRPWLLILQFWASFSRLIIALYESVILCYQINVIRNWSSVGVTDPPDRIDAETYVLLSLQLGLWIILVFNDVYISVIDFKRTNTYVGCVATQASISLVTIIITTTSLLTRHGWAPKLYIPGPFGGKYQSYGSPLFLFAFPTALGMLCSICLFLIALCPAMLYGQYVPLKQTWKSNTKSFLTGTASPHAIIVLSIAGQPRISRVSANKELHAPGNVMSRFLSPILFRRVSPAETRGYAFARNSFALVSIIILVFRTITALQKAQNQIATRLTSNKCDWGLVAQDHNLRLLLAIPKYSGVTKPSIQVNVTKNEDREQVDCWLDSGYEDLARACSSDDVERILPFSRTFSCQPAVSFKDYRNLPSMLTYHIEVTASNLSSPLTDRDMPDLWLSNRNEIMVHPDDSNDIRQQKRCHNPFYGYAARLYTPSWTLRPGYHVEAEAQLATRRFITSSFISDLIFNSEPEYSHVSLYPIVESGASILPNNTRTTATLRVTFKPAYVYSRDRKAFQDIDRATREPIRHEEWCTFIQDYREGNVFDVVGSIGGLFALLQAAHVLLFGRPMLWGLTGAKLLTPFGILGACSSRNFRRRLREQYHREPTEDNPETLRIGAFLRDFIIELGPAEGEYNPPAGTSSGILGSPTRPIDIGKNSADSQVPLLSLGLRESPSLEKSDGASGVQDSVMHLKDDV